MGDEKIDPERIRRILNLTFAQNPTALDIVLYRFGLEGFAANVANSPCKIDRERSLEDLALLLGLNGTENVEDILNDALRNLRGR